MRSSLASSLLPTNSVVKLTQVFSGLHRFGYHSAASVLSVTPDVAVYAKILTGGLLPLSATLASKSIFDAFLSERKVDALLHGHSYTANPIGCAVALKALGMIEDAEAADTWRAQKADWGVGGVGADDAGGKIQGEGMGEGRWSFWQQRFLDTVSRAPGVKGAMAMGTVLAIELEDSEAGESKAREAWMDKREGGSRRRRRRDRNTR